VIEQSRAFGLELRRRRTAAGLSLARLAGLVHYSKGYLSKIETGAKRPPTDLARRCDNVLDAKGELAALVTRSPSRPDEPGGADGADGADDTDDTDGLDGEVWLMNLSADGTSWFRPVDRRDALSMGAASLLGFGMSIGSPPAKPRNAPPPLHSFRALFDQLRGLGQTESPDVVLPTLIAQTHTLHRLAARAPAAIRADLLALTARYAEFVGWMTQEAGDDQAAMWWTAKAVELATAGNDHDLATYALVRRSLVTLYRDDAIQTIDLARRAQSQRRAPARIRGLAALREAQGHALAGDHDACLRCLDRSRDLLERATEPATTPSLMPTLGTVNLMDMVAAVTGCCLHELGRPHAGAEILDREVARIPPRALRARARFGVRRAFAHAAAGEIEHACALTGQILPVVDAVGSATVALDLRRLARTLSRWRAHPSVRDLYPRLTASLYSPPV
jgi:transcriptional regulator with XRE-family HTH domain